MEKKFAYLDKVGIMHVVESREVAEEFCKKGKVVETEIRAKNGFPIDGKGQGIIVYGPTEMKYEAADKDFIVPVKEFTELYRKCEK